jgi:hypothetical protein
MAVFFGRNTFVVTAPETTWGTTPGSFNTNANKVISTSIARTIERDGRSALSTSDGAIRKGYFDVSESTGGSLSTPLYFDSCGLFLKAALGDVSTTPSGGDYVHEYKTNTTDLPSFSLRLQRGSDANGMEEFSGLMISSAEISVETGAEAVINLETIGKTGQTRTTKITPTYNATAAQVYHYEGSQLTFNGVSYHINNMNISIDNKLSRRQVLGSLLTLSPDVTDFREITMSISLTATNNNLYNAMINKTEGPVEVVFTKSGTSDTMGFKFNNAIITDYSDDIGTVGRIDQNVTFTALATNVAEAFRIRLVNQNASAIAP